MAFSKTEERISMKEGDELFLYGETWVNKKILIKLQESIEEQKRQIEKALLHLNKIDVQDGGYGEMAVNVLKNIIKE